MYRNRRLKDKIIEWFRNQEDYSDYFKNDFDNLVDYIKDFIKPLTLGEGGPFSS